MESKEVSVMEGASKLGDQTGHQTQQHAHAGELGLALVVELVQDANFMAVVGVELVLVLERHRLVGD